MNSKRKKWGNGNEGGNGHNPSKTRIFNPYISHLFGFIVPTPNLKQIHQKNYNFICRPLIASDFQISSQLKMLIFPSNYHTFLLKAHFHP